MTAEIRREVVEAMARAMYVASRGGPTLTATQRARAARDYDRHADYWPTWRAAASAALDAFLDALAVRPEQ